MEWRWCLPVFGLVLISPFPGRAAPARPSADSTKSAEKITFAGNIAPFLNTYCTGCHGGKKPKAAISFEIYKDEAAALKTRKVWERVARQLRAHEMPPPPRPKPSNAEIDKVVGWIDAVMTKVDCTLARDPGRVTVRRLNRTEYNNTIRDLVGVNFRPAEDFPADDVGYGFDNIGDVLSLPPILMEKYLAAAEKIVATAFTKPETKKRILILQPTGKDKTDCARKIVENFAGRAFRRPLHSEEVDRLANFVKLAEAQGDDFEKGIQLAATATLVSPHFLFRIERDREPNPVHPLNDFELATRLSYFLWSSMPDDELFALARKETLTQEIGGQVKRMLSDPKARALTDNFASQWLQTRNLKTATPDPATYPAFDEALRSAMLKETELFFEAVVNEDRSILDFLDADFTFVNERLARHYGIPNVRGEAFRKVALTGEQRGGVISQASILTITSNPTRTSPVKRGKWILENILGTPPPPPPPGVEELSQAKDVVLSGSLRKRMELHRAKASCAICHQRMDPLGFGLENFDGIGAWRTKDGNFAIDSSGVLPGGESFQGPRELKAILKQKETLFRRCMAEKMLTYALGRGLEYYDKCAVDDIVRNVAQGGNRFSSLVLEVVKSDPFQKRRGKGGER